jgi:hypothetical protein
VRLIVLTIGVRGSSSRNCIDYRDIAQTEQTNYQSSNYGGEMHLERLTAKGLEVDWSESERAVMYCLDAVE